MEDKSVTKRLDDMIELLQELVKRPSPQDWYSTAAFARLTNLSDFTVREYCRLGRINAVKKGSGRGRCLEWTISHEEFLRYQEHGLLPPDATRNRPGKRRPRGT